MAILKRATERDDRPPLSEAVILILLAGWGVEIDGLDKTGMFTMAMASEAGEAALWREHEGVLRAEAKRRGIAPHYSTPRGLMFSAERIAAFPRREDRARFDWEA